MAFTFKKGKCMNNFVYDIPTKVYFGKDEEVKVGKLIKDFGAKKVLLHYGGKSAEKSGLLERVRTALRGEDISFVELGGVRPNPELPMVRDGIELCQKEAVDFILAVGGGSVLDSAKDIANGAANQGVDVWDFSLKKAEPLKTIPKGAILTISSAGSEMSSSCVITNPETGEKRGYNSRFNRMDFVIENPELTYTVSAYQTACGAVDAAMHTIERYFFFGEDTYLTDSIAEAVIRSIMKAGKDAIKDPTDYTARANMMWASSLAHNDLTHYGRQCALTVHQLLGLEHEIGGMFDVAHGAGLAALWCSWARYVYKANFERFLQFSHNVWGLPINEKDPEGTILKAIDMQEDYYREIGMPTSLKELDVKYDDLEKLALGCSMNKTRVLDGYMPLGYDDILEIYKMAY